MDGDLREFDLSRDIATLADLMTASRGITISQSDIDDMVRRVAGSGLHRAVISTDGNLFARTYHQPWFPNGTFATNVTVRPDLRRRGLGTRLLEVITGAGVEMGATRQLTSVADDQPGGMAFALHHGFVVLRHTAGATLDPSTVDERILAEPAPPGIAVTTLEKLGDTDAHRQRLWEISEQTGLDVPGEPRQPRTYAQFTEQMLETSWFRLAGQFIALDGNTWVGVAAVGYTESSNTLYHNYTGVDARYRGRGIASALKRATIRYAVEIGASILETHNDSTNTAMLAINRALGYQEKPGYSDLDRSL